jgi:GTPase SAR1 family protein
MYLRTSNTTLLFFSVLDSSWKETVIVHLEIVRNDGDIPIILVATKCDHKERCVTNREARDFARENNLGYIETSAKEKFNHCLPYYAAAAVGYLYKELSKTGEHVILQIALPLLLTDGFKEYPTACKFIPLVKSKIIVRLHVHRKVYLDVDIFTQ